MRPFVRPVLVSALSGAGRPDLFFWSVSGGAVVAFLIILTLPETKGRVLD